MAKQEPTKSSAASIDETTKALFGQFPADVIIPIRWGEETLDRLEAVFHAAYSGEAGQRFHAKLDTHSRASWTVGA